MALSPILDELTGPALVLSSGWALVFAFFANQLVWPLEAESHASMTVADLDFGSRATNRKKWM